MVYGRTNLCRAASFREIGVEGKEIFDEEPRGVNLLLFFHVPHSRSPVDRGGQGKEMLDRERPQG